MTSKALFLSASNTYGCVLHMFNGKYNTIDKIKALKPDEIKSCWLKLINY